MMQSQHLYPLFPDLIENQRKSMHSFWEKGILEEFALFSYITGKKKYLEIILDGARFFLQKPQYTIEECIQKQKTYSVSLFLPIHFRWKPETGESPPTPHALIITDKNTPSDGRQAPPSKQAWWQGFSLPMYCGELPLMTERGSFLINGSARVLVNQIVRCPSVYFKVRIDAKNRRTYIGSFLSEYGSWLRIETDSKYRIWARIDTSQRVSIYALLRALGFPESFLKYQLKYYDFLGPSRGPLLAKSPEFSTPDQAAEHLWKKLNPGRWNSLHGCYSFLYTKFFHPRRYSLGTLGRFRVNKKLYRSVASKVQAPPQGEAHQKNQHTTQTSVVKQRSGNSLGLPTLTPEDIFMAVDRLIQFHYGEESVDDIDHLQNRRVRLPGELIQNQLRLGLNRLTQATGQKISQFEFDFLGSRSSGVLTPSDKGSGYEADLEAAGKELDGVKPLNLTRSEGRNETSSTVKQFFQSQLFAGAIRELFHTSQLSQYMDQTNPLAEITHKRRLSSLGPGGIGRDQAGVKVREIHPSHFGRICPIETPEGPNAGLVGSLATYCRVSDEGFLLSPYRKAPQRSQGYVQTKQATHTDWFLFPADTEDLSYICSESLGEFFDSKTGKMSSFPLPKDSQHQSVAEGISDMRVAARYKQEFLSVQISQVNFSAVSPIQMISLATSLIPFLEHDDANRALMGSNMQRQAVPLLCTENPFVGTGLELQAARDSSTLSIANKSGQVTQSTSAHVVLKTGGVGTRSGSLASTQGGIRAAKSTQGSESVQFQKIWRSNQNTSIHQKTLVECGEWVEKGDLLADGSATHHGEIALGKNILVGYMTWEGYNFEDAIVINERLVDEDIYTSLHIDRYDVEIRDTPYGKELITRDLTGNLAPPRSTSEESAETTPSSSGLLNGIKATSSEIRNFPSESTYSPLLEKSVGNDIFLKQASIRRYEPRECVGFANGTTHLDARGVILPGVWVEGGDILVGKLTPIAPPRPTPEYRLLLAIFETKPFGFKESSLRVPESTNGRVLEALVTYSSPSRKEINSTRTQSKQSSSDAQNAGEPKKVYIFLAHKRKIQLGDKMSGRHGNKGIVSLILPPQDMPFLQDGRPLDIVLNPLGVPSRMNVGQVLEALLGLATSYSHKHYRLLPFDEMYGHEASRGLVYTELHETAKQTGLSWLFDPNTPGKTFVFDGRTGESFKQPVLVGVSYILKLIHLVDEKMHARSTGSYSLVTQQPLQGKSKGGGQRCGEMELWAFEGYGAASVLHEILTIKSDAIDARNTFTYFLMKRQRFSQSRLREYLPDAFRVLISELKALCLTMYYNPVYRLTYPSLLGPEHQI